jgi:hypothetical protein
VEVVGKVVGWEANGLALEMSTSAKLKAGVIKTLEAVNVVARLAVAAEDRKVIINVTMA